MKHKYLVALACGGVMEQPHITYQGYQLIDADDPDEATDIYNAINECTYFYGYCLGEVIEDKVCVPVRLFIRE